MSAYLRDPNTTPIRIGAYPKRRPLRDVNIRSLGATLPALVTSEPRYIDFLAVDGVLTAQAAS